MHTKNLENSSKIECFMGQNASVRTSMATTVVSYTSGYDKNVSIFVINNLPYI